MPRVSRQRAADMKYRYGVTEAQYLRMFTAQDGRCKLCGRREEARVEGGKIHSLVIDHDHRTGKVRGLLCRWCNAGLGLFDDDPKRMRKAAAYLTRAR